MANDLNQCNFIGRLGADIEQRFLPSGDSVSNFRIAVGKQWRDKGSGDKKESTTWVQCVAFGKLADVCSQYLAKGSRVFISGEMSVRKWQDQSGQDRYSTEIKVRDMQMLDSPGGQQGQPPQQGGYQSPPPNQAPQNQRPPQNSQPPQQNNGYQQQQGQHNHQAYGAPNTGQFADFDDSEIPFN